MIGWGERISRDLQLWITILTIGLMVGALIPKPKFWLRRQRARYARR